MKEKLAAIKNLTLERLEKIIEMKDLDDLRVKLLGKKGELTAILKTMGTLSPEERPQAGQLVNEIREFIENNLEQAKERIKNKEIEERLKRETIDVTLPGRKYAIGHKHPMTTVIDELKMIFVGMGYEIAEGPEVETDYYNFEALNIPANHPAKDEQDTFYVEGGFVLRTQTSSVQIRVMENSKPPIRVVSPGCVYRSDEVDATHSPVFHQLEGLIVDKGVTMGNLKGTLEEFAKTLFGERTKVRFRPHHFAFTEPSAEMDVSCYICGGVGCSVCKHSGWVEILGCGMVHPKVLEISGIDPGRYSGFAFGLGLERIAMQRYNITDMRLLFENDVKFLKQF